VLPPLLSGHRSGPLSALRAGPGRLFDLEDLVEPGDLEHLADMLVEADEGQALAGSAQALLDAEQDAEAGAGDVIEVFEVDPAGRVDPAQVLPGAFDLRRVEPALEKDVAVFGCFDVKHQNPPGA